MDTCDRCKEECSALVDYENESGEHVRICKLCETAILEREDWEAYCADTFNAAYERARAQGWSD